MRLLLLLLCARVAGGRTTAVVAPDGEPAASAAGSGVRLALLMMLRNEAERLRANLPLWGPHVSAYVAGVDERTTDDTAAVLLAHARATPPPAGSGLAPLDAASGLGVASFVFYFAFDGFGRARTATLRHAWARLGEAGATHVLVGDPDWAPRGATVDIGEIARAHHGAGGPPDSFQFVIWDRNGATTRHSDWLLAHRSGIWFARRIHETVMLPDEYDEPGSVWRRQVLAWEVRSRVGAPANARRLRSIAGFGCIAR